MNTQNKCEGKTKLGSCCKKKCAEGSKLCCIHKNQSLDNDTAKPALHYYNEECPVCFSSDDKMHITPCMHRIHIECAKGMNKMECPLCMAVVTNYPMGVVDQIKANGAEYQNKLDNDDFENFVAHQNATNNIQSTIHISPSLNEEILSAIHYLKENGIPLEYIPKSVKVSVYQNCPSIPMGALFYAIVGHSIEKITSDLGQFFGSEYDDDFSEEYDDESEENPFSDATTLTLSTIEIKIL